MRISDWSSDVCSSDLRNNAHRVDFSGITRIGQGYVLTVEWSLAELGLKRQPLTAPYFVSGTIWRQQSITWRGGQYANQEIRCNSIDSSNGTGISGRNARRYRRNCPRPDRIRKREGKCRRQEHGGRGDSRHCATAPGAAHRDTGYRVRHRRTRDRTTPLEQADTASQLGPESRDRRYNRHSQRGNPWHKADRKSTRLNSSH